MNIEKTWKTVLEQLQTDLPRAAFDTWVRDTQALSSAEGTLTVAVRNAYARDWLERRLEDTVNDILSGNNLRVKFVVEQELDAAEVETNSDAQETKPAADDRLLGITSEAYDSVYEQIVRPDRAVYLPGYFRRWLSSIGPELGWMYVSFRQAAYRHGGRNEQFTNRFSVAELANRAGITERTFWNRSANPVTWEKLSGLVTRVDEGSKWDFRGGTPKQLPRKFTVAMTLPLTPVDAASLRNWLIGNQKNGGAERALRSALAAPLEELLPLDAQTAGAPATVRQVAHELFDGELDGKLIDALAAGLQNHIMPANDQIKITVFFMEHVLPHLGSGPAWIVTLLRDRCFSGEEETRNRVVVEEGYAEIASWLGMSRVKTVWEWLNQKKSEKYVNGVFRQYVRESENERGIEDRARTFYVLLEEVGAEMLEAFVVGKEVDDAKFSLGMAEFSGHLGGIFSLGMAQISAPHGGIFSPPWRKFQSPLAQISVPHGANFRVKNSLTLKPSSQTPKDPQPSPETENQPSPEAETRQVEPAANKSGGLGNMAFWDFDFLTLNNSVNPGGKAKMLKANKNFGRNIANLSDGFVSWLLYAYSPTGAKISDPVGLAVKRLCENVNAGAGGDFNRLAKLTPYALRTLFDADMSGVDPGAGVEAGIYKLNFQALQPIYKQELYRRLFGEPEGASA